ncbi:MAG TPA: hypothetical protein VF754_07795 [Pyrinomonadaceae bacterium]
MSEHTRAKNPDLATRPPVVRRAASRTRALARYVMLGAVALSILPAQAFAAALPLLLAARAQDDAGNAPAAQPRAEVNARPLRQLLDKAQRLRDEGSLDLSRTIEIAFEADLDEDASLTNVSPVHATPDAPRLRELGEDFISALSESHLLASLKGASHLRMALRLDASKLTANLSADIESDRRAADMATGYNALFSIARATKRGQDVAAILNGMTVSASGKQLAFRLEMSRAEAGNLLLKQVTPN